MSQDSDNESVKTPAESAHPPADESSPPAVEAQAEGETDVPAASVASEEDASAASAAPEGDDGAETPMESTAEASDAKDTTDASDAQKNGAKDAPADAGSDAETNGANGASNGAATGEAQREALSEDEQRYREVLSFLGPDVKSPVGVPRDYRPQDHSIHPLFRIDIGDYGGPLDLLVYLIRKHEIDIFDIPIKFLTERYLEMLEVLRALDIDVAAEFLVLAADLTHIKSKMLLPAKEGEPIEDEPEDAGDPRADLVRRLLEYQKYRDAATELGDRDQLGRDVFARQPPLIESDESLDPGLKQISIFKLVELMAGMIKKKPARHEISYDSFNIAERMHFVMRFGTSRGGRFLLVDLMEQVTSRSELVVTFIAVLESTKLQLVRLRMDEPPEDRPSVWGPQADAPAVPAERAESDADEAVAESAREADETIAQTGTEPEQATVDAAGPESSDVASTAYGSGEDVTPDADVPTETITPSAPDEDVAPGADASTETVAASGGENAPSDADAHGVPVADAADAVPVLEAKPVAAGEPEPVTETIESPSPESAPDVVPTVDVAGQQTPAVGSVEPESITETLVSAGASAPGADAVRSSEASALNAEAERAEGDQAADPGAAPSATAAEHVAGEPAAEPGDGPSVAAADATEAEVTADVATEDLIDTAPAPEEAAAPTEGAAASPNEAATHQDGAAEPASDETVEASPDEAAPASESAVDSTPNDSPEASDGAPIAASTAETEALIREVAAIEREMADQQAEEEALEARRASAVERKTAPWKDEPLPTIWVELTGKSFEGDIMDDYA